MLTVVDAGAGAALGRWISWEPPTKVSTLPAILGEVLAELAPADDRGSVFVRRAVVRMVLLHPQPAGALAADTRS